MTKTVSPDDRAAILDLIARYYWAFDDGDAQAYDALWHGEGLFTGFGDPIRGREGLSALLTGAFEQSQGRWRHGFATALLDYGQDTDTVTAKAYCPVYRGGDNPGLQMLVLPTFQLIRTQNIWKITAVHIAFA